MNDLHHFINGTSVKGVTGITNNIEVEPRGTSEEVKHKIESALR
jgi:hypothetical protein